MKDIGKNIRQIRATYNISQKKLGELVGCSTRTVSDWELRRTEPPLDAVKRLCEIFELEYTDLLDEIDYSKSQLEKLKNADFKQNNLRFDTHNL